MPPETGGSQHVMRAAMTNKAANKKGAVAPFVAIMLVVLFGCLALVVDLGKLYNVKVQLQRTVDSAALAGALKLDGSADELQNARNSATAAAMENIVNGLPLALAPSNIVIGAWESGNYEALSVNRFNDSPGPSENYNAVKISKSIEVDLVFAKIWNINTRTVTADAIAVTTFEEPGLPIALLSCIPINEGISNSVCNIKLYKWATDPEDTAGWTGLTFNTNAQTLKDFFNGVLDINRVLYGENDTHRGLENTSVLKTNGPSGPCGNESIDPNTGNNHEYDIKCGLGNDFDDFSGTPPADPLAYDPLPRWYNETDFERILTMDDTLSKAPGESDSQFQTRMGILLTAASSVGPDYSAYIAYCNTESIDYHPAVLVDNRFTRYIEWSNQDKKYIVHPEETLRDAGYPLVQAKNGQDTAALAAFIDSIISDPDNGHFKPTLTANTGPFAEEGADAAGETLPVTIPVIFAGECGDWKALKGKFYIGTANLLLTRVWKNNHDCWDEGEQPLVAADACVDAFSPTVPSRTFTCVTKKDSGAEAGIEALIWEKGKEDPFSGILRVQLVE